MQSIKVNSKTKFRTPKIKKVPGKYSAFFMCQIEKSISSILNNSKVDFEAKINDLIELTLENEGIQQKLKLKIQKEISEKLENVINFKLQKCGFDLKKIEAKLNKLDSNDLKNEKIKSEKELKGVTSSNFRVLKSKQENENIERKNKIEEFLERNTYLQIKINTQNLEISN